MFAVAEDSPRDIRRYLTIMKTLVNYKIQHVSGPGQKANTCAQAIIDWFRSKIELSATRYRAAHEALASLDQDGPQTMPLFHINCSHHFKALTSQDMVFLNEDADDSEEEGSSRAVQCGARKRKQ